MAAPGSARPQSRGLQGGIGGMAGSAGGASPVPATMRPGTMMHGGQGVPPGTSQRLGTRQAIGSRQGTAANQPLGVGAHTQVTVAERPMTTHGLSGMKTGSLGPKRQVYDKTYYMQELRKRVTELTTEINKMRVEVEEISQGNTQYQQLEKRYDTLVKNVRNLEGDLADHNLATDKQRTDTRPEEVHHMYMLMKLQNDEQRNDIDQIFLEKKSHEEEINRMNDEIASISRASEERLNELHPDQRRDYETLREENHRLTEDLSSGREELDTIQQHLANLEGRLRNDMLRMRMQQLTHLHKEVSEKHQALQEEAAQCSLSVPEQRELLLNKVKSDNAEIVATEKRNSELKLEKERIRQALQDVAADTQERQSDNEQHKYEILFAKDQEMTQFINGFDDAKAEEEGKLKQKQDSILLLLENISKATNLQNVTPEGHLRDMEDELTFKMKEMQNSENTQCRLEGELAKRQGELDKIETLDVKITDELRQVETRMKQYEEEIENKFDRIDEMRSNGELQLRQLEERKIQLEQTVPALKQQTGVLKLKLDAKRQQAQDDEAAAALEAQEKKISQFGQTLNALATFIKQKSAETDFQVEQANCLEIANILNKALLDKKFMIP